MQQQNYHSTITADATPREAFNAVNNVSGWWAKNFKGSSQHAGDTFTVDFGQTFVDFKVTELIPDKKIVWLVTDCHLHWINNKTEWTGTKIVFEITPVGDATKVSMTHVGLVPGVECYADCEQGWNDHFKNSLFKFLTRHEGMPM
jgi:hypothetical protein